MLRSTQWIMNDWRKRHKMCKMHLPPYMALVIKVCYCTLSAPPCRDAGWQLGTWPTHWTTKWEKWPAFTSSFKNSFTSCQIPLWPGTCTRAAGQDWAWAHRPCWPSSYQPDPAHRSSRQLILLCQGFLASLLLFFLPLHFPRYLWCALGKEQVIIRVPETLLLLVYTITVQYVHLKASAERISPAKCWALNKLSAGGEH